MRKASKSSSKNLPVDIVQENGVPPDLIVVYKNMFNDPQFNEKIGIKLVSIGTERFQLIGDIARVDNL